MEALEKQLAKGSVFLSNSIFVMELEVERVTEKAVFIKNLEGKDRWIPKSGFVTKDGSTFTIKPFFLR